MSIKKVYLTKDIILQQYKDRGYDGLLHYLATMDAIIYTDDFSKWVVEIFTSDDEENIKKFKLSKIWLV